MRRLTTVLLLVSGIVFGWPDSVAAGAGQPFARMHIEAAGPVEPGADIVLRVDVLVPTWFLHAPRFPETFELPGATVELVRGSAGNLSESIDGATWAGLRRSYRIQPLNPGRYRLPELAIPISYAREGNTEALELVVHARSDTVLQVRIPQAASHLEPFIAAHRLQLAQRIERPERPLGTGDAVRRTIVLASDAAAAELPADVWVEANGMRLHLDPPRIREQRNDATARASTTREQSATWVFDQPGSYELPPLTIAWWNPDDRQVHHARLPAVPLTVTPRQERPVFALPETVAKLAPDHPAAWRAIRPLAAALGVLVLLVLGWHARHLAACAATYIGRLLQTLRDSEWWLFHRLLRTCRRHDPLAARNAWQHWIDCRSGGPAPPCDWPPGLADAHGLRRAMAELDAWLYGDRGTIVWHGSRLARELVRTRRRCRRRRTPKAATLPATLNP